MQQKTYIAIDLKSFYASVECVERGLDPLTTNLVVADGSRTEKTICLAVSPSLKALGISGRARLYEVVQRVERINNERRRKIRRFDFDGSSYDANEIASNDNLAINYIVATPRMAHYMEYSTRIYQVYLRYIAPEDIHVYSIDEVFIDASAYLNTYQMTAHQLAMKLIHEVLKETSITATAGIGTNMYLAKVAMDIVAKHIPADKDGVRIAELDEMSYRQQLWNHRPLTDFWRVGRGYQKRLEEVGINTMGDVARCSIGKENEYYNEELLYKMFGINAELLIDHAWGYEPTTIKDIKSYKPSTNSISSGQVLMRPYNYQEGRIIVREMAEGLVLDLIDKGLTADSIGLAIGYDVENLSDDAPEYDGDIVVDYYGRKMPKASHSSINLDKHTDSYTIIMDAAMKLYNKITNRKLSIRRVNISANNIISNDSLPQEIVVEQLDLFGESNNKPSLPKLTQQQLDKEKRIQKAILDIKKVYGKNSIVKVMDLQEGATALDRNKQIGGHKE